MTTEHEDSPVRHFCAQLDGFVRAAGQTRASVVSRHPMSDSQVYAVLAGTVKTPPSFDRMVVPIIETCGGDAATVAQWRARHDAMVRVHELQKSLRRKPSAAPAAESRVHGADATEGRDRSAEVQPPPGRRLRLPLLIVATMVVTGLLASGLTWALVGDRTGPAANPAAVLPQRGGAEAPDTPCRAGAPAAGGDLLEVPRPDAPGDPKFGPWWANSPGVRLGSIDTHGWTATVESGAGLMKYDMLVIRGCLPVTAGHRYTLGFTASASTTATIGIRVQNDQPPRPDSLMTDVVVTPQPQSHTLPFEGAVTSRSSEVTFQLGGNPALSIEITDIVLTDLGV